MAEKRFIPFLQAVREGIIKEGERVNISACLPKTEGVVTLAPDETGGEEIQTFDRNKETKLEWHYFKDNNGIASLVSTPTDFKLYLKGLEGYENGLAVLQRICWTFANAKIGLAAHSLCYEDSEIVDIDTEWTWLASPYAKIYCVGPSYFGLRCMGRHRIDYGNLYNSDGDVGYHSRAVRTVVSILTSDICIDLESKEKDGVWRLVPPEKEV